MSVDRHAQERDRVSYFASLYQTYLSADIDMTRSPVETMEDQWYEQVGRSAAKVIHAACVSSWLNHIESILDMPCGHGRVLRHLAKLFPDAELHACDIDAAGVAFCASRFAAVPVPSTENPDEVVFPRLYDCIWVGSLFTHLSKPLAQRWLGRLAQQLSPTGIVIATWHGRWSAARGGEIGYIDPQRWRAIVAAYEETGYGYASYQGGHQHRAYIAGDYGVSLSSPAVVLEMAAAIPGVRVFGFVERGWAGHQDVLVLGKPGFMV